ncbi:hypothetical protein J007_00811 [Cryptococcus neoformans]|nr:hypothetical protein J007_00811 [Cryptococcus neoformans var. grubii]OXC64858.1 hypothetical protein C358_00812 [Cryptococcus neoformans var. grubii MW-RSA852]
MPEPFGSFGWICSHTVLPQCNLFFSQLFENDTPFLTTLFPESSTFFSQYNITGRNSNEDLTVLAAKGEAGTGVGSNCEIARIGQRGSSGDIALIVLSALAVLIASLFVFRASRRWAAVGRAELRLLFVAFGVRSALQIVTMTSLLKQGSKGLVVVSAIHIAIIVVFFLLLLGNALIATQVVEDGTAAALAPLSIFSILFFVATLYISLDTGLHWSQAFHLASTADVENLKGTALFVFSLILPTAFSVLYILIMLYIVIKVLDERKPAILYLASFAFLVAAQLIFFLASQPLCNASNGKVNSAFITTFLEIVSMTLIYLAWVNITEDDWGQDEYGMY